MKRKFFTLATLILTMTSCSDDQMLEAPNNTVEPPMSRAIVGMGNVSTSNPNLISDWENQEMITLNTLNAALQGEKVTAPWANGCMTELLQDFRKDIRKADGWKMLFHTFNKAGGDKNLNYMFFYNIFTGIIKVFYYYEGDTGGSTLQWDIHSDKFKDEKNLEFEHFSFFDNPDYLYPIKEDAAEYGRIILNNATPGARPSKGWNGFEFKLARYATDLTSTDITITPIDAVITDFNFDGIEQSNITGTVTTVVNVPKEYATAVANSSGSAAEHNLDDFASNKLSTVKILDAAKIAVQIATGNYIGAITSGLKFFFGGSSASKTTYNTSDVRLKSEGTITLKGVGKTNIMSGMSPVTFNLWDVMNPSKTSKTLPNYIVNASNEEQSLAISAAVDNMGYLGNWTLSSLPKVYYDNVSKFDITAIDKSDCTVEFIGNAHLPDITRTSVDVVFNPNIAQYITSYSVSVDIMDIVRRATQKPKAVSVVKTTEYANDLTSDNRVSLGKGVIMRSPAPSAYIQFNRNNLIYSDETKSIYKPGGLTAYHTCLGDLNSSDDIDDSTQYYFQWNGIRYSYNVAFVTVTMKVKYLGNDLEFIEIRPYDVNCLMDPNVGSANRFHNPPYMFVVNQPNFQLF